MNFIEGPRRITTSIRDNLADTPLGFRLAMGSAAFMGTVQGMDIGTTQFAMENLGALEGNPLVSHVIENFGTLGLYGTLLPVIGITVPLARLGRAVELRSFGKKYLDGYLAVNCVMATSGLAGLPAVIHNIVLINQLLGS